jgi:hypothetical protein
VGGRRCRERRFASPVRQLKEEHAAVRQPPPSLRGSASVPRELHELRGLNNFDRNEESMEHEKNKGPSWRGGAAQPR